MHRCVPCSWPFSAHCVCMPLTTSAVLPAAYHAPCVCVRVCSQVVSVERVQNPVLWRRFELKRAEIAQKRGSAGNNNNGATSSTATACCRKQQSSKAVLATCCVVISVAWRCPVVCCAVQVSMSGWCSTAPRQVGSERACVCRAPAVAACITWTSGCARLKTMCCFPPPCHVHVLQLPLPALWTRALTSARPRHMASTAKGSTLQVHRQLTALTAHVVRAGADSPLQLQTQSWAPTGIASKQRSARFCRPG